jgi:WD40 repeat protein
MTPFSSLLQVETNFNIQSVQENNGKLEIYTVDSDFMVKLWDISYGGKGVAGGQEFSETGGRCKESVIVKPCGRYYALMSQSDAFKNQLSRGVENLGAVKR